jgi:hypothetical protein
MHERSGLQCLVGRFIRHLRRRQLAQFAVDQGQQSLGSLWVALLDGLKNPGNVAQLSTSIKISEVAPEDCTLMLKTLADGLNAS